MHATIGTGLSSSVIHSRLTEGKIYDKARYAGGRIATKPLGNGYFCDLGATFFSDLVELKKDGLSIGFSFLDWLHSFGIHPCEVTLPTGETLYYLEKGMQSLAEFFLKDAKVYYSKELVGFQILSRSQFQLQFLDGSRETTSRLTITAPLPQALGFFPEGEEREEWEEFTRPYSTYRKTLVSSLYWQEANPEFLEALDGLGQTSFLDKGAKGEYISIESAKPPHRDGGFVFLIQFSEKFSDENFDDWQNPNRCPTENCVRHSMNVLEDFRKAQNLPAVRDNAIPDVWRVHKWRYAQAESSLMGKTGILDLDSPAYREYERLCKKTNIRLVGDWLYGPRMERITAGLLYARDFA